MPESGWSTATFFLSSAFRYFELSCSMPSRNCRRSTTYQETAVMGIGSSMSREGVGASGVASPPISTRIMLMLGLNCEVSR